MTIRAERANNSVYDISGSLLDPRASGLNCHIPEAGEAVMCRQTSGWAMNRHVCVDKSE